MKTRVIKEREISKYQIEKYFNALKYLKEKLDNNEKYNLSNWVSDFGLRAKSVQTVQNLSIIKNIGKLKGPNVRYVWNDRIPVSIKLARTLIIEMRKEHNEYIRHWRETGKVEMIKPTVKKVSKQINIPIKEMSTTVKNNEIGLIRKFWKWIY